MDLEKLYLQYCKDLLDVGEERARAWLECAIYNTLWMQKGTPWSQVLDIAYDVIHYAK